MTMKKKHFEAIAEILHNWHVTVRAGNNTMAGRKNLKAVVSNITTDLCDYFQTINPNFDPVRFREAVRGRRHEGETMECQQCEKVIKIYRDNKDDIILEDCPHCGDVTQGACIKCGEETQADSGMCSDCSIAGELWKAIVE